jgi:hypothetical protein
LVIDEEESLSLRALANFGRSSILLPPAPEFRVQNSTKTTKIGNKSKLIIPVLLKDILLFPENINK